MNATFFHRLPLALALVASAAAQSLQDGLTIYYDFEETGTAGLANKVPGGSGFDATRHGTGDFDSSANPSGPGFSGNAAFDPGNGASDRSELLAGNALNLVDTRSDAIVVPVTDTDLGSSFTISVWHALTPSGGSVARPFVFEQANNNYNISWGIGSGDNYTAYVTSASALAGGTLERSAWNHVAHVFESDEATTTLRLYVNGQLVGTRTGATSALTFNGINFGRARNSANGRDWDGMMDEIGIWDRALDASEVFALHNLGRTGQALTAGITTHVKADNTTALNLGGAWDSGNPPAANDYLVFNSTFTQAGPLDTGTPMTVAGLRVADGSGLIDLDNTSGTLTLGDFGIDLAAATRDLSIADLAAGETQGWNVAAGRTLAIGALSGAAEVSKLGAGQLLLDGANTHVGTLVAKGGLTTLGGPSAIPTTGWIDVEPAAALTLTLGAGGFAMADFDDLWDNFLNGVFLFGTARAGIDSAGSESIGTTLSGIGGLAFSGGGTLTVTGDNDYTGGTSLFAGTLRAGSDTALGTGALTMEHGTRLSSDGATPRVLANSLSLTGDVTLGDATDHGALTVGAINLQGGQRLIAMPSDVTVSGPMSNGGFTKTGSGTMSLTSATDSNLSGPLTVAEGALTLGGRVFAPSIVAGPATSIDWTRNDPFYASGSFDLTIEGAIVGGADRPNYFWGTSGTAIRMNEGTLKLGGTAAGETGNDFLAPVFTVTGGGTSTVTRADGNTTATLRMRNLTSMTAEVAAGATLRIEAPIASSDAFNDTSVARSGGLTKTGVGDLVLTGDNTYGGDTLILEGTLRVGEGGSLGGGGVINDAILEIDRGDASTLANAISGTGTLVLTGGGSLTLTGTHTYTGDTTVEDGTLTLDATGQLAFSLVGAAANALSGSGSAVFDGIFQLDLSGADLTDGNSWTLASVASQSFGPTFSVTSNDGAFSRSGTIHALVANDRTWTFDEATGTLTVNDGAVLSGGTALKLIDGSEAGAGVVTLAGGTLWLGEGVEVSNEITLVGPASENVFGGTLPIDYLVVGGGGGGGGRDSSGGGGGGGVVSNLVSPGLTALPAAPGEAFNVSVGDGGAGGGVSASGGAAGQGSDGEPSALDAVMALGGGGGGSYNTTGKAGASGGGGGRVSSGGSGTSGQGFDGGAGSGGTNTGASTADAGAGGGGAGAPGGNGVAGISGGAGGAGLAVAFLTPTLAADLGIGEVDGSEVFFGGGGGGTPHRNGTNVLSGDGGLGGGGAGTPAGNVPATGGTPGTGGGGGAARSATDANLGTGGQGGSGAVLVRYPGNPIASGGDEIRTVDGFTYHAFATPGAGTLSLGSFTGTSDATVSGTLGGDGGFTWKSTGSLTLAAAGSYTGDTVVEAGTLVLQHATLADGSSVFLTNGATLDLAHGQTDTVASLWINGVQQPAGTYNSGNSGGAITGTGSLLVGGAPGGFAAWIGGFFPGETDPAIVGPDADANGDGVANALVYLFGGDPKDANNLALLPTAAAATDPGGTVPDGDYLVFAYRRDATADVTATVEHSATLTTPWMSAIDGVDGVVVVETADGYEPGIDRVEVFIPRTAPRRFTRLHVNLP